jgi:xylulokinase
MMDVLMGIDVGTTSTKAVLFDLNGKEIARASSQPYQNFTPNPGWVEQDPEELWQALLSTIHAVILEAQTNVHVLALSMAVQSGSLIPADANGMPVYNMITWLDGRAEEIVNEWKLQNQQAWVKPLSGWSLYSSLCLPTIAWLKKHNHQVFNETKIYFSLNDFLTYRLTGKMVTNPSNAGGMQLLEIQTAQWSAELCALAGIQRDNLCEIQPSAAVIGEVLPEICASIGLSAGTLLVNGGHDQGCTALGLGITDPGKILLACGTAWVFTGVLTSADMRHLPPSLDLNFHVLANRWTLSQSLGGLGASFEWWFKKSYLCDQPNSMRSELFSVLNSEILQTDRYPDLFFLPMTGGHIDPGTTSKGGFIGLQLAHSRANMARSVMESAAYELRWALEPVLAANIPVERLWMVGGAAQSAIWPLILANVTGIPICIPDYDNWPALGAAILAGIGAGVFLNEKQGLEKFNKKETVILPEAALQERYAQSFLAYRKLWEWFH